MKFSFTKMHGTANDFVIINHWDLDMNFDCKTIVNICDRRLGVGADGVILIEPSEKADFKMRIMNSDGSQADMCGNGLRCAVRFVCERGLVSSSQNILCESRAGLLEAQFMSDKNVSIRMVKPKNLQTDVSLTIQGKKYLCHCVDTGVPHAVLFVDDLKHCDLEFIGKNICFHSFFEPQKTNVNCVQVLDEHTISIRTYERGVFAQTWACGTGATASAIVAHLIKKIKIPMDVIVKGGRLRIDFKVEKNRECDHVFMTGPAENVFNGEWNDV